MTGPSFKFPIAPDCRICAAVLCRAGMASRVMVAATKDGEA
jgi:hypothetical protein